MGMEVILVKVGVEDTPIQLICDSPTIIGLCYEVLQGSPRRLHIAVQILLEQIIRHLNFGHATVSMACSFIWHLQLPAVHTSATGCT